jgi:two-component system, OmpR family, sensor kinase
LLGTMREAALVGAEVVDVGALVRELAARMQRASSAIRVSQSGSEPLVRGHAQSIERALTAVLHNALTHGDGHIDVDVRCANGTVCVDIVDRGSGFSDDALAHATERFWRADSARSRGGTGLGLSIARVLIEAHGGEIRLANERDRGAVVSLLLPMS